jgi:hypothetical protein
MPETISYVASGTVPVMRFVKQGGAQFTAATAGAGDIPLGVSYEGSYYAPGTVGQTAAQLETCAPDGKALRVYGDGEAGLLIAGANVSGGSFLVPDANGFGTPMSLTATGEQWYGFRSFETAVSGYPVRGVVQIGAFTNT